MRQPPPTNPDPAHAALSRFHQAFALMSVIPLLIAFYLVTVRFFSLDLLVGLNAVYFIFAVAFALLGLFVGRRIIQDAIQHLVEANARSERLLGELATLNTQLTRELTERRRSEEQLKASNAALQTTQLQLIQAAKMESIGRLAAGVAHEVKNPLAIILMGVAALSRLLKVEDANAAAILKDIADSVNRADAVIKGLLDFSAPEELTLDLADLNAVIEQSLLLVKHELDKRHIALVKQLSDELPWLKLDRRKIEQAFINLFMNAIHAMSDGGTLTVRTGLTQLMQVGSGVGHRRTDRFQLGATVVVAEVEDTGPGIEAAKLATIFDPFFTTKPTGQGTGLGLTVTQKILELHGGTVQIRNLDGRGAGVTLCFRV